MAVSVPILAVVVSLHLIAFVLAVGAERRRSTVTFSLSLSLCVLSISASAGAFELCGTSVPFALFVFQAKVDPDEYDWQTFCVYASDASTVYGLAAFGLLLVSQAVLNGVTRCLCFGKGLVTSCSTTCAIVFFIFSW